MQASIIGLDIAKSVFHLVGQSRSGAEVLRKKLRRAQVLSYFIQLEPCLVGIEACGGAHYWGRELQRLGHRLRLLPPRAVKAYLNGAKNDYNDAAAICEALKNPRIHAVAVKSVEQQDWQMLHGLRQAAVKQRTALANRLRGQLAEHGVVVARGIGTLRRRLPEVLEEADNALSALARELFAEQYQELLRLDEQVHRFDQRLAGIVREHEVPARLAQVCGIGPLLSSALPAHFGDARQFGNGRALAACIGLVPHQHSSGGKPRLLGISKRGNAYLRSLFINGARAVLSHAQGREDRLSRWALALAARRPYNVAVVALANKLARIAWVVLARGEAFDPARA